MHLRPILVAAFLAFLVHPATAQKSKGPHVCCPDKAECVVLGPGCAPSGMEVPVLASHRLPEVGSLARVVIDSPSTRRALALLAVGFSSSFNATLGVALPFDLAPIGFPGCSIQTSADAAIIPIVLHGQGQFQFHYRVPGNAKWCGAELAFQALVLGPNTTCRSAELLVSNGLRCLAGN